MSATSPKSKTESIGKYQLLGKLAEGNMGAVFKARDPKTGQLVAVKLASIQLINDKVLLKRFEQEYRTASTLDHPNLVRALDFGIDGSSPYLIMEFVEGETLRQRLDREVSLPEAEAIRLIGQVAGALSRAHKRGLIHL